MLLHFRCARSLPLPHLVLAKSMTTPRSGYEHARSVSRSPQADSDTSPTRSLHWAETSNAELEKVDEEPLRFHCHATFRFKYEKSLRKDDTLRFMDAVSVPAVATNAERGGSGIST